MVGIFYTISNNVGILTSQCWPYDGDFDQTSLSQGGDFYTIFLKMSDGMAIYAPYLTIINLTGWHGYIYLLAHNYIPHRMTWQYMPIISLTIINLTG